MKFTRRDFVRGGVSAFSLGFAAPRFLCDIALAQGAAFRNLVVLYLGGGNDSLSMLVPYRDQFYQSRRPTLAVPAGQVLQIGRDSAGNELGLHPRLTGLRTIFNEGRLALIQRTGYENSSRSHFEGTDIWSTANPLSPQGPGWLGRYLDTIPAPVDPLYAWNTGRRSPALAAVAARRSAVDQQSCGLCVSKSQRRGGSSVRARGRDAHVVASSSTSPAPGVRQRQRPVGIRDPGSRRHGGRVSSIGDVPGQRIWNGTARDRRRAVDADRHANFLGADRRLRYARGAEAAATER